MGRPGQFLKHPEILRFMNNTKDRCVKLIICGST